MFKGATMKFKTGAKSYGFVKLTEDVSLDVRLQYIEDFDGAIIYGELKRQSYGESYCIERYKIIVEPPTRLEKFLGITLEKKIQKAIKKAKKQCMEFINHKSNYSIQDILPRMVMSIV